MSPNLKFGWLSPAIGNRWSDHQPIVVWQDQNILPTALPHFDSLWLADHFYGFDAKTDPFMEAWTTLTCLARPRVRRVRLRLPQAVGALRSARGGHHDLSADVDRGRALVRRRALPDRRRVGAAAARSGAAHLHRRRRRADRTPDGRAPRRHV